MERKEASYLEFLEVFPESDFLLFFMEGFMKRLGIITVLLLIVSVATFAAARFTTTSGDNAVVSMKGMENPAQTRAAMNTPQVQKMVKRLQAFLVSTKGTKDATENAYVGSEYCMACHTWSKNILPSTKHFQFLRRPIAEWTLVSGKGVMGDADGNGQDDFLDGLDFNTISSAFDAYKPNAPILSVEDGTYYITIGDLKYPVVATLAGYTGGAQRFMVRIPVTDSETGYSKSIYFAPISWGGTAWTTNSPANWYAGSTPVYNASTTIPDLNQASNYSKTCVGCHTTGIRELKQSAKGEWEFHGYPASLYAPDDPMYFDYDGDGIYELMNIGCEACHGPGSRHILGAGDPEEMLGADDLVAPLGNEICGRCHNSFSSVPNNTFSWPFDDANMVNWTPDSGLPLSDFYEDTAKRWPDGIHVHVGGRPYDDYIKSVKPTYPHHMVTCAECHSPHSARAEHQLITHMDEETDAGTVRIDVEVENNTLCLGCHATHGAFESVTKEMLVDYEANVEAIGKVVAAHSHHPYAPERIMGLSRCTYCHMPTTSGHGTLTSPSHVFDCISPEETLKYQAEGGMPNSCAVSCHDQRVNIFGLGVDPNPNNGVWNEQFDVDNATELAKYYGLGGTWWDTTPAEEK